MLLFLAHSPVPNQKTRALLASQSANCTPRRFNAFNSAMDLGKLEHTWAKPFFWPQIGPITTDFDGNMGGSVPPDAPEPL